jgi:uncharacterized protein
VGLSEELVRKRQKAAYRLWVAFVIVVLAVACRQTVRFAGASTGEDVSDRSIAGLWQGSLKAGGVTLRVVFKIEKKPDGSLAGTLDSIDQGAKDIPLSEVHLQGSDVRFQVSSISGVYEGKLAQDGAAITGEWKQGGVTLPLKLERVQKLPEIRRPQEPQKPYPYPEEEVVYENRQGGSRLAGTLTLPRDGGPFPAVLLITGSGAQDRNETVMGHRPFLVLADALTRRGIAVLRVDDRGVGGSTGEMARATTQEFAGDALAGVAYLKTRKEIDPRKIGLIGHSEGGLIAPICAARSKEIAFIVLMAGPGLPGEQILYRQSALIMKVSGLPSGLIAKNRAAQEQIFAVLKREMNDAAAEKAIRAIYARLPAPSSGSAKATAPEKATGTLPAEREASLKMMLSPWFRYFLTYDPRPALRKVTCPVLAVNGEKDLQVPAKENLRAVREALRAGGNRDYTVRELPSLNHLFQTSRTGSPDEYARIEETIAPAALQVIGDWIVQRTR